MKSDTAFQKLWARLLLKYPNLAPYMELDPDMQEMAERYEFKQVLIDTQATIIADSITISSGLVLPIHGKVYQYRIYITSPYAGAIYLQYGYSNSYDLLNKELQAVILFHKKFALIWLTPKTS